LVPIVVELEEWADSTTSRTSELARPHAWQFHTLYQAADPRADLLHAVLQPASHLVSAPRALPLERRRPGE
jgi:hypothetical protein